MTDHKGINLPGVGGATCRRMSEKDIEDLRWALHLRSTSSRCRSCARPKDVDDVHKIMDEEGIRLPVIAKVEKPQAVDNMEDVVKAFDGVMVARGDLGVEYPLEEVPIVQKRVIELARRNAKPVIVATQMLESMITNPAPTRAEASDVANAVLDGADAVMLSAETSVGAYPIETVKTMARIIASTEDHVLAQHGRDRLAAAAPRAARSPRPRPRWRSASARVPGRVHAVRRHRAPALPLPRPIPVLAFTPEARCARSCR